MLSKTISYVLIKPWLRAYYIRLYESIKFQKSKVLLWILLKFTCSKTNGLLLIMGATAAAKHSSFTSSSVSLFAGFDVTVSLSAFFQAYVKCSWIVVILVCPDVPSMEVPTARHYHSSSSVFHRRYHRLWSKVDLGVLPLFGLCEGHLYHSPSRPPNYLGLQK